MDYEGVMFERGNTVLYGFRNFDPGETLDCGQSFRWVKTAENTYEGIAFRKYLSISLETDKLILRGTTLDDFNHIWRDYFDFGRDYGEIKSIFNGDETLSKAISFTGGIRVLRQEPWEALCTFILSQNNNIPRIKGLVQRLCECFGEMITGGFAFPPPERLAGLNIEDLAPVRAGFRAKYILDAARKVASGEVDLGSLYTMLMYEAKAELMKIHGVGPKVADCTLLYGLGRVECVPMDVWMKRVMSAFYPNGFPGEIAHIAGIAQQYLFHYMRTCDDASHVLTVV